MWNIFKRPIESETIDAWAKISDDIAKVAILAIPVMLYGNEPLLMKVINTIFLVLGAYFGLFISRHLRRSKQGEPL